MPTAVEEELSILQGTKSPHGYLASPLSDNIHETDEGYLIVVGCPIARTGWQKYTVADLPQTLAKELGVNVSNPSASIDLYRPAKEVFNPEFLASLNGKPITDGHPPGGEFVNPDNFNKYSCGHIQNVRKGTEPMDDGEWPIIADLVISAEPLIGKVRSKQARELSLGYDFSIDRDGDKIIQCQLLGNHNAVVPKGRAGDLIRIQDAAPTVALDTATTAEAAEPVTATTTEQSPQVLEPIASVEVSKPMYAPIVLPPISNKEKQTVAQKKPSWLRSLMGKHLIELARATDATPEGIMDEAEALHQEELENKHATDDTQNNEFKSEGDKKAKDGEVPAALKEHQFDRKAAHDALDRAFDKKRAKDVDVTALKTLLDEFLTEEADEPEHVDDSDPTELEAVLKGAKDDESTCAECGLDDEDCECDDESELESGEEAMDEAGDPDTTDPDDDEDEGEVVIPAHKEKAADRARAADGATAVLKMLRPVVARTGDKAVQSAFNRALDSVKRTSRTSTGSYGKFASSARARDRAPRNPNPDRKRAGDSGADPISKMQAFYNEAHNKGGK